MGDKIFVKNLVLPCSVGITKEERAKRQNVILDIEIGCDLMEAGNTDDLTKSIDYARVQEEITRDVTKGEFKLLESLAQTVASIVLRDDMASQVKVAVKKEKYAKKPILGIEISRDRNG
ncbi:MAG: dihydroneopterin aldolase [Ignavibacteria bacterium]